MDCKYGILPFTRCGFYDYRLVRVNREGGAIETLYYGRFVCTAPIQQEIVHEVWVDVEHAQWNNVSNRMTRHGSFDLVAKAIPEYKALGVTT